ncbi:hypothetical protein LCGC14_1376840 [marine sediment metagenome]|uniref:Uncharacterized protein n=1 Tax=marine sediment metagenome TaxID=412755 RepID=A0A0F9K3X9_9ZZZZ
MVTLPSLTDAGQAKFGSGFNISHRPEAPLYDTPDAKKARKFSGQAYDLRLRLARAIEVSVQRLSEIPNARIISRVSDAVEGMNRRKDRALFVARVIKEIRDGLLLTAKFNPSNARRAAQARLDQIQRLEAKAAFLAPDIYGPETESKRICSRFTAALICGVAGLQINMVKAEADTIDELRAKLGIPEGGSL